MRFSYLIMTGVPLMVYLVVPKIVTHFGGQSRRYRMTLIAACLLFFVSYFVPSPYIHDVDTNFMGHLIGGGLFCGALWLYLKQSLGWKHVWWQEIATIYALTCAFGVFNELFEVVLYELHAPMMKTIADTSYDLVANTLGAGLFYLGYWIYHRYDRRHR